MVLIPCRLFIPLVLTLLFNLSIGTKMKCFNHIFKNAVPALLLLMLFSTLAGCKKGFLDRAPQGQYTADDYPYPGGSGPYDTYLFGAYSDLRDFNVHS